MDLPHIALQFESHVENKCFNLLHIIYVNENSIALLMIESVNIPLTNKNDTADGSPLIEFY